MKNKYESFLNVENCANCYNWNYKEDWSIRCDRNHEDSSFDPESSCYEFKKSKIRTWEEVFDIIKLYKQNH